MTTLFIAIIGLILLFSIGVGGYITFFKVPMQNRIAKIVTFLMLSMATTAVTFMICLAIVWPPVRM